MRHPVQFGKYLLLDRIAVGGMAEVFAAKAFGAEGFQRILAIKKILPTLGEDPEFVSMFVDEARIAVQLTHANIVQVLELGKHDETLFIAMEYVSGRDLRQLLDRYRRRAEPLPIPQACAIAARVCEALDYAHRKRDASGNPLGIVHRDVSPQNVLVSFDGDVKLIDFGIAKAERRLQETQSGILKGKFSYMSPEQVRGGPVDRRSDVFAAGVLLWELICGRKLFTGESDFAVLEKVRKGEVPPPASVNPAVPEALSRAALAALAVEPRDRYQWCSELHDDLLPFTHDAGVPVGSRRLAGWIREELHSEHEKEQARMRRWLGLGEQQDRTSPDVVRGRAATGGAIASTAEVEQPATRWHLTADGDTLVRPPTPTGRTRPGSGAEPAPTAEVPTIEVDASVLAEEMGAPQPTRTLRPGQSAAPAFDSSGNPTGARRNARTGALTGAGKARARMGARALAAAVAITLGVAGAVWFARSRGPVPGKVIVTVQPAVAAELLVDGRSSGPLPPFVRHLPAGRHRLEVKAEGYEPFAAVVELGRRPVEVEVLLSRDEPAAPVQAQAPPPETRPQPAAPVKTVSDKRVVRHAKAVEARRPAVPVEAPQARQDPAATADEQPASAAAPSEDVSRETRLHVISDPIGAEIRLAGKSIGRAPLTTDVLQSDREYELSASLEGYLSVRRAVRTVTGVTDVTVALPLQPVAGSVSALARGEGPAQPASALIGYLVTNTRPAARVIVDGRETGRWTPVPEANPIALPAGAHTIVFETADGKRHEESVQIEPGKTARLVRDLPR
ncbi:MAG: protein kinase domain-containing protein [Myxococcales bacterium]